jgi:hypothetical protein
VKKKVVVVYRKKNVIQILPPFGNKTKVHVEKSEGKKESFATLLKSQPFPRL